MLYTTFYYDKYPYILLLWIPAAIQYKGTGFSSLIIAIIALKLIIELISDMIDLLYKE